MQNREAVFEGSKAAFLLPEDWVHPVPNFHPVRRAKNVFPALDADSKKS